MSPEGELATSSLLARRTEIAAALVELEFRRRPDIGERYGAFAREKSLQDAGYHLAHLAQALAVKSPALFVDYVAWAKVVLRRRQVLVSDLAFHLECLAEVLREALPAEEGAAAEAFVVAAVRALPSMPDDHGSALHDATPFRYSRTDTSRRSGAVTAAWRAR